MQMRLQFSQSHATGDMNISEAVDNGNAEQLFASVVAKIFCDPSKAAQFLIRVAGRLDGSIPAPAKKRLKAKTEERTDARADSKT